VSDEWENTRLGDQIEIKYGKSSASVKVSDSSFPIYGTSGRVGFSKEPLFKGPVILVGRKGTLNNPFLVQKDCWIIDTAFGVYPKNNKLNINWLYFFIKSIKLEKLNEATGVPSLSKSNIESIFFSLPSLSEQQKIADILTSVYKAIEKTEAIIAQTETVKKGLMQQLLTKGIGQIRFKQTEIGKIPEEWEVRTLGELTNKSAFGPRFPADCYNDKGNFALLRTTDISSRWEIEYSNMPSAMLDEEKFNKHVLEDGDLLVTRSGTCGIVSVFKNHKKKVIPGAFLIRFRLTEKVVPVFVKLSMMLESAKQKIEKFASGGVQKNLSGTNLKKLLLPLPSIKEQQKIVSILFSIDQKITTEQQKLTHLQTLKKGLMQVLLTGKVRVKVNESEKVVQ
jgi:type I restriction enzyme S subunit